MLPQHSPAMLVEVNEGILKDDEEGIKEKKEGVSPDTSGRLLPLFIRSTTVCLPIKALLFFISFYLMYCACVSFVQILQWI